MVLFLVVLGQLRIEELLLLLESLGAANPPEEDGVVGGGQQEDGVTSDLGGTLSLVVLGDRQNVLTDSQLHLGQSYQLEVVVRQELLLSRALLVLYCTSRVCVHGNHPCHKDAA